MPSEYVNEIVAQGVEAAVAAVDHAFKEARDHLAWRSREDISSGEAGALNSVRRVLEQQQAQTAQATKAYALRLALIAERVDYSRLSAEAVMNGEPTPPLPVDAPEPPDPFSLVPDPEGCARILEEYCEPSPPEPPPAPRPIPRRLPPPQPRPVPRSPANGNTLPGHAGSRRTAGALAAAPVGVAAAVAAPIPMPACAPQQPPNRMPRVRRRQPRA